MPSLALPAPPWLWGAFVLSLPVLLWWDLRHPPANARRAAQKTLVLASMAAAFALALWQFGPVDSARDDAFAFVTAYLVELSLSVDNLFVFLLLFQSFAVDRHAARRVLTAGIFGALVLRAGFIGAGLWLVAHFSWLFFVFGGFLLLSGLKLLWPEDAASAAHEPAVSRALRRLLPMATAEDEARAPGAFFVTALAPPRALRPTRLMLVLLAVEASDIVFALDSVPAGFAVTGNGWLLFAANAFAIVGLRALFVALDDQLKSLRFLRPALAVVLSFIGGKMLLAPWLHVSMATSLAVIVGTLAIAVAASLGLPSPTHRSPP